MTNPRRQFISRLAAMLAAAGIPPAVLADVDDHESPSSSGTSPATLPSTGLSGRVVVVGGGMAGAAVAKFLRLWGGAGVQVTLVEREPRYTSNILSNLVAANAILKITGEDELLSFLPLSHVFERLTIYLALLLGARVTFAESLQTVSRDLARVRPTILTGVLRVFEKFHHAVLDDVENDRLRDVPDREPAVKDLPRRARGLRPRRRGIEGRRLEDDAGEPGYVQALGSHLLVAPGVSGIERGGGHEDPTVEPERSVGFEDRLHLAVDGPRFAVDRVHRRFEFDSARDAAGSIRKTRA